MYYTFWSLERQRQKGVISVCVIKDVHSQSDGTLENGTFEVLAIVWFGD